MQTTGRGTAGFWKALRGARGTAGAAAAERKAARIAGLLPVGALGAGALLVGVLLVGALLLGGCGGASEPTPTPLPTPLPPTATPAAREGILIVAMGDSLTEGLGVESADAYPAQLQRKLQASGYDVTVVNAGVSGETSSGALSRVDWVLRQEPDIVVLATGGNDGLRGVAPQITQENIDQIVQKIEASGAVTVLAGMEMVQNMGTQFTSDFRAIYPEIAARHELILMPFLLEGVAANPDLNQPDFIHPTAEGYTIVTDNLYPYVVQAIEQVQAAGAAR